MPLNKEIKPNQTTAWKKLRFILMVRSETDGIIDFWKSQFNIYNSYLTFAINEETYFNMRIHLTNFKSKTEIDKNIFFFF